MKKRHEKKGGPTKPKPRDKRWDWIILAVLGIITIVIFAEFIFTDRMLFGTDMIPMGYMMRKAVADAWRATGTLPLWDSYILCGLPVVDAMHGDLFYPVSAFYLLMPLHKAVGYKIVIHVWLAGVAMFLLLRTLGLSRKSSFLAGVGYMVAPYFLSLTYAGHDAKMFVTALFPLSVMLLERLLRGPRLLYAALFGAAVGLLLLTSHPQMAYFASWGLGIYFILNLPRLRRDGSLAKGIVLVLVAVVLGIGLGCVQLLPTYQYTTNYSPRTGGVSFSFASSWSLHPEEIVSLMYPSFVGYLDSYWGRNPFKLNAESPGPLIVLLAIGGFILLLRRRDVLPWLVLFVFCHIYALGAHTPVFKGVFQWMPGAKFLRAPSIIMFMFSCSASVLAAFFMEALLSEKKSSIVNKIVTALLALAVILALLFIIGQGVFFDLWRAAFGDAGAGKAGPFDMAVRALRVDAILLAVFAVATLTLLRSAYGRKWDNGLWLGVVLAGVLVTSLPHSLRFIDAVEVRSFQQSDPMIEYVLADKGTFRTLPMTHSSFYNRNFLPLFGIETANGFYDNRIRYFDEFAGEGFINLLEPAFMSMSNVKYVLTTQRVDHPVLDLRRDLGSAFVYENRRFLPRAFLVHEAVIAGTDSAAMDLMKRPGFDPARTIVLHDGIPTMGDTVVTGEQVILERDDGDRVVVRASVRSPGYLFYSGNYLPYWKAYVDGEEAPVVRCNVSFRAIHIEPGEHVVEMKYVSPYLRIGAFVCLVSCGLIGVMIYAGVRKSSGRRRHA